MNKQFFKHTFIALIAVGFFACKEEAKLRTYEEAIPAPPKPRLQEMVDTANPYLWLKPDSWEEQGPKQMRLAGFNFKTTDISVSRFPGKVGSLESNLQRWAGQISLTPTQEALQDFINGAPKVLRGDGLEGALYDFCAIEDSLDPCISAVIFPEAEATMFVKAMGPRAEVLELNNTLVSFVQTIKPKEVDVQNSP